MTRPRAADDFATIHARLVELRREREQAAKQDIPGDDSPGRTERSLLGAADGSPATGKERLADGCLRPPLRPRTNPIITGLATTRPGRRGVTGWAGRADRSAAGLS